MHSHLAEAGFTQLWWIRGAIFATLTAVGIGKVTTKGPLQWDFNGWTFYSFIRTMYFGFFLFFLTG
jgi:hypothetical protein